MSAKKAKRAKAPATKRAKAPATKRAKAPATKRARAKNAPPSAAKVPSAPNQSDPLLKLTLDGQLMAFRTAWLRIVALVWYEMETSGNDNPLNALKKDPQGFLQKRLNFTWPWADSLELVVKRAPIEDQRLRWIGDDWAWDVNQAEQLIIRLPLRPRYQDAQGALKSLQEHPNFQSIQALALADYYNQRPSIFGSVSGGGQTPRGRALVTSASLDIADQPLLSISDYLLTASPIRFGGKGAPAGGFIPAASTFLNLEVALVSGLAKAWGNESFTNLLDGKMPSATLTTAARAIAALATSRGYLPEWRLELSIENDDKLFWIPPSAAGPSRWQLGDLNKLTLNFPEKPENIRDTSVALAAYNSTGAEFPFTCCA